MKPWDKRIETVFQVICVGVVVTRLRETRYRRVADAAGDGGSIWQRVNAALQRKRR
jgi:hypothetical protein